MKDKKEKLEIKKKPQEVKKEDLDKVAGGTLLSKVCFCPSRKN